MNSEPMRTRAIALLGRRDEPTDGVQDYCERLAGALAKRGWTLEIERVPWLQLGWLRGLRQLSRDAKTWRGHWVLVQYTALAWSRRAFPLGLLAVLWVLRRRGARCVVVFHDLPYPGDRWIDRLRRSFQSWVMRAAYRRSEYSILTLEPDKAAWLPASHGKAIFIPVGANIFSRDEMVGEGIAPPAPAPGEASSLAVFGVTSGLAAQRQEVEAIVYAAREAGARLGGLHLLVMGRGALEAETMLREGLSGSNVRLTLCGLLGSREISERLAACDAMVFVRGEFSTRRGSGLAGIACGAPMVAYKGAETGFPLEKGGIVFVPRNDVSALAAEVTRVLGDNHLRDVLRARNESLFREWFSWDSIAERLVEALGDSAAGDERGSRPNA